MKISVCVIALNEGENIKDLFSDLEKQDFPHEEIEIVLVDGNSEDNTRQLMVDFQTKAVGFGNVLVLDNPKRIQASGWNIAIKASSGELILRIDAHARIPSDFVRKSVECIESGEDVCGGRRINIIKGETAKDQLLLLAENSMFGSGIAPYRHVQKKQYVKTLAHACYRRDVFEKVGLFNENILRAEDNELHYRIRQAGYRFCLSDEITSEYLTRSSLSGMIKQKYGNGKWVGITAKSFTPKIFSFYHFVPFLFVLGLIGGLLLSFVPVFFSSLWWFALPLGILFGIYFLADCILTISCAVNSQKWYSLLLFFLFPLLHISYGWGTLIGLFHAKVESVS